VPDGSTACPCTERQSDGQHHPRGRDERRHGAHPPKHENRRSGDAPRANNQASPKQHAQKARGGKANTVWSNQPPRREDGQPKRRPR